jgi:uncharacterized membrane protein YccC
LTGDALTVSVTAGREHPALIFIRQSPSTGMETGSPTKRLITLLLGILIAYLCANTLSNAVVVLFHLTGPVGMVVSFVVYAVIFFTMLHLLQKYAHVVFFGFDRN